MSLRRQRSRTLQSFIDRTAEFETFGGEDSVIATNMLPPLRQLRDEGLSGVFSRYVVMLAGVDGAGEWLDENSGAVDSMVEYFDARDAQRSAEPGSL